MRVRHLICLLIILTTSCQGTSLSTPRIQTPSEQSVEVTLTTTSTSTPQPSRTPSLTSTVTLTSTPPPRVEWRFRGSSAGVPSWDLTNTKPSRDDLSESLRRMKSNGVNWYQLSTTWFMTTARSTEIKPIFDHSEFHPNLGNHILPTINNERLEEIIGRFHDESIKVFLRPNLEVNDGRTWRGQIRPLSWEDWFEAYTNFIVFYAQIAEKNNVELLSIGFELNSSVHLTKQWNSVIFAVREVYSGDISYDCGGLLYHGNEASYSTDSFGPSWEPLSTGRFLANVDYIGVDWYPQVARDPEASIEEIQKNIERISDQFLLPIWQEYNKPIFFAEIDYSSMDRTTINPLLYRWGGPIDEAEQALAFEAVFETFHDETWFEGMFPAGFYLTVFRDSVGTTNSLWYKTAEEVFRYWYAGK